MKLPRFEYHRPASVGDAVQLLADLGGEAKILAGGQSLLPVMALRIGAPAHLVDIGAIPGLDTISSDATGTRIGCGTRHAQAEEHGALQQFAPLLAKALPFIGHRAIRNRGTLCGSIAHADPAAELPAVCRALDATMIAVSVRGERAIPADEFFTGFLDTALEDDELLTEVRFPEWGERRGAGFGERSRRHGDYGIVGAGATVTLGDDTTIEHAALVFTGVGPTPIRAIDAEQLLLGATPSPSVFADAARAAADALDPPSDLHGSANYRRHLAAVLAAQALGEAAGSIR
ncbi:MAG: xanthine dehydrogenase family protein subunit M [Acidimicrobiales bacterium]